MCLWGIADEAIEVFLFRERDIACTEKSKDGMIGVRKRKVKKLPESVNHLGEKFPESLKILCFW